MRDEAPIATALSDADRCTATESAASGSTSTPLADLVTAVAAVPPVAGAARIGVCVGAPDSRRPDRRELVRQRSSPADAALHRIRLIKDWDELEKVNAAYELCWLGQEAVVDAAPCRA